MCSGRRAHQRLLVALPLVEPPLKETPLPGFRLPEGCLTGRRTVTCRFTARGLRSCGGSLSGKKRRETKEHLNRAACRKIGQTCCQRTYKI